jgi:ferrochelatase
MAAGCDYEAQLRETCRLVAERAKVKDWELVFQSRSGSPAQPWLEPDICAYLRELKAQGGTDVVVAPVGFTSDHMEVKYDLDTEARQLAAELGLNMIRAATVGTHPDFIKMIRELIIERLDPRAERRALGTRGASHDVCPADCCLFKSQAQSPMSKVTLALLTLGFGLRTHPFVSARDSTSPRAIRLKSSTDIAPMSPFVRSRTAT